MKSRTRFFFFFFFFYFTPDYPFSGNSFTNCIFYHSQSILFPISCLPPYDVKSLDSRVAPQSSNTARDLKETTTKSLPAFHAFKQTVSPAFLTFKQTVSPNLSFHPMNFKKKSSFSLNRGSAVNRYYFHSAWRPLFTV